MMPFPARPSIKNGGFTDEEQSREKFIAPVGNPETVDDSFANVDVDLARARNDVPTGNRSRFRRGPCSI
jgi:hypothetical protein